MSDNVDDNGHDQGHGARALRRHCRPRGLLMLRAGNDILLRRDGRGARSERQGAGYRLFR